MEYVGNISCLPEVYYFIRFSKSEGRKRKNNRFAGRRLAKETMNDGSQMEIVDEPL